MKGKYYWPVINSYDKRQPTIEEPKDREDLWHLFPGDDITNWKPFEARIVEGCFCSFILGPAGLDLISPELRQVIESFTGETDMISYLPCTIKSDKHGEREYFVLHFNKTVDVADMELSHVNKYTGSILMKPVLDWDKVSKYDICMVEHSSCVFVVSHRLFKAIKKAGLKDGTVYSTVYAISKDDPDYQRILAEKSKY